MNKLCDVAFCWVYEYIGILLGARPILHISRLKVNVLKGNVPVENIIYFSNFSHDKKISCKICSNYPPPQMNCVVDNPAFKYFCNLGCP
jgi:hypothetical protein